MIKHLVIMDKAEYESVALKDESVSIEMKMIIDDGSVVSPFIQMFSIDEFRGMEPKEIEELIEGNVKHISRSFYMALHCRKDCLNVNN